MAGNIDPIATRIPYLDSPGAQVRVAATVVHDGSGTIGTDIYKVWTAETTNGGYCRSVIVKYVANAVTASTACVLHFYRSTQTSGATTDVNTQMIRSLGIPALTPSTTVALPDFEVPIGIGFSPGETLLVKVTVTQPASCGFVVLGVGGKY